MVVNDDVGFIKEFRAEKFGVAKTPVTTQAGATQGALGAYTTGAFGLNSDANMLALYDLVVAMRAALVANGIIKGSA